MPARLGFGNARGADLIIVGVHFFEFSQMGNHPGPALAGQSRQDFDNCQPNTWASAYLTPTILGYARNPSPQPECKTSFCVRDVFHRWPTGARSFCSGIRTLRRLKRPGEIQSAEFRFGGSSCPYGLHRCYRKPGRPAIPLSARAPPKLLRGGPHFRCSDTFDPRHGDQRRPRKSKVISALLAL